MIYLIGADHKHAQRRKCGEPLTECQLYFRSVVESAIQSVNPGLLAEEDHRDYLSRAGADSILLEIATARQIADRHRLVDPNDAERERIGYRELNGPPYEAVAYRAHEIMHQFPKREEFWLGKLLDYLNGEVLFVCGWGHIESFTALLARKGVSYSILANKIGACPADLEFYDGVRQYIKDNLERFDDPDCFCIR